MTDTMSCHVCGNMGFDCNDGFYYCQMCGSQAEGIIETGVADEDFLQGGDASAAIYIQGNRRSRQTVIKTEPYTSQSQTQVSQFWRTLNMDEERKPIKQEYDEMKPYVPDDFGGTFNEFSFSPESLSSEIRIKYTMGVQLMIQYQCEVLVETFHVNPLICGLVGVIWLRYVAVSRVFDESWADDAIEASEMQKEGDSTIVKPRGKYRKEPHNIHGQRAATIWLRSLRKKIPLSTSLALTFLACHIAREAILPTDIVKWSLEGKLPYLNAFLNIEKTFGRPSSTCPFSSSFMFRPFQVVGPRELEAHAGSIALSLGLELPPVNFFAIARRYLKLLHLPVEKILPYAIRIYEWSMPPDLWLPANPNRLPTRLCVMSIIVVAIRVLYNINGFGKWEEKLSSIDASSSCPQVKKSKVRKRTSGGKECFLSSDPKCKPDRSDGKRCSPSSNSYEENKRALRGLSHIQNSEFDTLQLLGILEATYDKMCDTQEYLKDLPTYLKYCRDVVFDGLAPSFEDHEEENIIKQLWQFYENQTDSEPPEKAGIGCSSGFNQVRFNISSMDDRKPNVGCSADVHVNDKTSDANAHATQTRDRNQCSRCPPANKTPLPCDHAFGGNLKERALEQLKSNMEENGFCYIPPRVNLKRFDYLHYVRKNDGGIRSYVAHADYYILLCACARLVQVDARYMHAGMLRLEKRLAWIEKRIDYCLHSWPQNLSPQSDADADADAESPFDMNDESEEKISSVNLSVQLMKASLSCDPTDS